MHINVKLTVVLFAACALPAIAETAPRSTPISSSAQAAHDSLPKYKQLIDQTRRLLRAESRAGTESERVQQAMLMAGMADRLAADPRYATSPTLQENRGRLHARLRTIKKRTLATGRRQKKKPKRIEIKQDVLAQLNQAVNGQQANVNNNPLPQDYGPLLVELIQRTISPASWDVNGGASTIQYWRPGMALVVRAPQGLHEQVSPVLGQLRQQ